MKNGESVMLEVLEERRRQDTKWGEQNHPITSSIYWSLAHRKAQENEVRQVCEERFKRGNGCWWDIIAEEAYEVNGTDDPAEQRKELVQLAAVCVAAIECLDRKAAKES